MQVYPADRVNLHTRHAGILGSVRFSENEMTQALHGAAKFVLSSQRDVRKGKQDVETLWRDMDKMARFNLLNGLGDQVLPVLVALPDVEVAQGERATYTDAQVQRWSRRPSATARPPQAGRRRAGRRRAGAGGAGRRTAPGRPGHLHRARQPRGSLSRQHAAPAAPAPRSISAPDPAKLNRTNRPPSAVSKSMPVAIATPVRASRSLGERHRVVGEVADVGVGVERAVGRRELGDRRAGRARRAAAAGCRRSARTWPSSSAYASSLNAARHARCASTGGQIVKLPVSTSTARRSRSGTSIQPMRQPVIEKYFEKLPNTTRLAAGLPRAARASRCAGLGVLDAVVDLVADQLDAGLLAVRRQRRQLGRQQHRAGRVGRAGDDEALEVAGSPASCSTVGWKRVSGPVGISTTSQPSAASTLR